MKKPQALTESKLFINSSLDEGEWFRFLHGQAFVFSTSSPEGLENQDSAALIPYSKTSGVLAVADGAGGMRSGAEASKIALKMLEKNLVQAKKDSLELRSAILNGFEEANAEVMKLGLGAATTLSVVEVQDQKYRSYHVGDSLILSYGQRGKIKYQTVSHSPVGYAVEAGLLDENEALHHDELHLISNIVGSSDMRIEIGPILDLSARDLLLIASDGLSDNLSTEEIIEMTRKGSLSKTMKALAQACRTRMMDGPPDKPSKPDDLTFIAFRRS